MTGGGNEDGGEGDADVCTDEGRGSGGQACGG